MVVPSQSLKYMPFFKIAGALFIIIDLSTVHQHAASRIKRNAKKDHKLITAVSRILCVEWHPTRACNVDERHDTWVV